MKLKPLDYLMIVVFVVCLLVALNNAFPQNINETLTNGVTVGIRNGGTFSSSGWTTTDEWSYIQYNVPTTPNGVVEFDVKGIYASNTVFPNCQIDKYNVKDCSIEDVHYQLICFWDRDDNNSWWGNPNYHNPFKMHLHLYGYVQGDIYKWKYMKHRLNVCAYTSGYDDDPFSFEEPILGPFEWNKETIYHHKLVWGEGHFKWYMDGVLLIDRDYSGFGCTYSVPYFSIRLGSALGAIRSGGYKAPVGITYSNFSFTRNIDTVSPQIAKFETELLEGRTKVTSDVFLHFSEAMDMISVRDHVRFTPSGDFTFQEVGTTACWMNNSKLADNTTYQVFVDYDSIKDVAGNVLEHYPTNFTFTTGVAFPLEIKLYQDYDLPLFITYTGNKYLNVIVTGVFTNGGTTITQQGFYDNLNRWIVRFSPTKLGTWSYTITNNINSAVVTGSFNAIESEIKSFIKANGTHFQYADGSEYKWIGDTSWRFVTSQLPYFTKAKQLIDLRKTQYYNAVQFIVHSYINGNAFWSNEGGQCFAGTDADYNQLNPKYFHWLDKRIQYANDNGFTAVVFFSWAQDYGLFSSAQWEKYMRYLVARYSAKNVMFIVCGEYTELFNDFPPRTAQEFADWGNLLYQIDPYKHLISLHPSGRLSSNEFGSQAWQGFIGQQTPYAGADITRDLVYGKPVVDMEPSYYYPLSFGAAIPNTAVRKQLYDIAKAGGYFTVGFYTTYANDKGGFDLNALPDEQRWSAILNKLILENKLPATYEEYVAICEQPVDEVVLPPSNVRIYP